MVRNLGRAALAMTAALLVVGGLAGVAAAKIVGDAKYVKSLCGSLRSVADAQSTMSDQYNTLDTSDPATFQTTAGSLVDDFVATIRTAQKKMKRLSPEHGGKKVTRIFDAYFTEQTGKVGDALAKFRAADPHGITFQGDVIQFQTALNLFGVGLSDPFGKVKDQDLLAAFDREKSCADFVSVIGG